MHHQSRVGIGFFVVDEGFHFPGGRWQTGQIVRYTADECAAIRDWRYDRVARYRYAVFGRSQTWAVRDRSGRVACWMATRDRR